MRSRRPCRAQSPQGNWGGEEADEMGSLKRRKPLYLVLSHLSDRLEGRQLRIFAEVAMGSHHTA